MRLPLTDTPEAAGGATGLRNNSVCGLAKDDRAEHLSLTVSSGFVTQSSCGLMQAGELGLC